MSNLWNKVAHKGQALSENAVDVIKDSLRDACNALPPNTRSILKMPVDSMGAGIKWIKEHIAPDTDVLAGIPYSAQLDGYSCGVQATWSILRYYGKARSILNVERSLGTTVDGGTPFPSIADLCRQRNLRVKVVPNAILRDIRRAIGRYRAPMLISVENGTHWAVVYGYARRGVFVLDSSLKRFGKFYIPARLFAKWWDNWGAIVYRRGASPRRPTFGSKRKQ